MTGSISSSKRRRRSKGSGCPRSENGIRTERTRSSAPMCWYMTENQARPPAKTYCRYGSPGIPLAAGALHEPDNPHPYRRAQYRLYHPGDSHILWSKAPNFPHEEENKFSFHLKWKKRPEITSSSCQLSCCSVSSHCANLDFSCFSMKNVNFNRQFQYQGFRALS